MKNYFSPTPQDRATARDLYRELMKEYHPDLNPSPTATAATQEINRQYALIMSTLTRNEQTGKTEDWYTCAEATEKDIADAIIEALKNTFVEEVELNGLWVWLVTDAALKGKDATATAARDQLKKSGYKFASRKKKWYYPGIPARNKGKTWSHNKIRQHYGSRTINPDTERQPAPKPITA